MDVVDSEYKYVFIDVGAESRQSDGGVSRTPKFGKALNNGELNTPAPAHLPGTVGVVAPYVFVGDEAFQLREDFLQSSGSTFYTAKLLCFQALMPQIEGDPKTAIKVNEALNQVRTKVQGRLQQPFLPSRVCSRIMSLEE